MIYSLEDQVRFLRNLADDVESGKAYLTSYKTEPTSMNFKHIDHHQTVIIPSSTELTLGIMFIESFDRLLRPREPATRLIPDNEPEIIKEAKNRISAIEQK
jgi:hypothetical protein